MLNAKPQTARGNLFIVTDQNAGVANSSGVRSVSHASQSDLVVLQSQEMLASVSVQIPMKNVR